MEKGALDLAARVEAEAPTRPERFPQAPTRYSFEVHDETGDIYDHDVTAGVDVSLGGDIAIRLAERGAGNATLYIPKGSPLYIELRETLVTP